jgi:hypothetical protein
MRILLTDIMFPNKYAKWRLVEIKSFIDEYKCDILVVNRIGSYAGTVFNFDWDILSEKFLLDQYDILIFNHTFNYINKYNTRIDGTKFNGMMKADYMLRHKSRSNEIVSFDIYDSIYHIFLMCYQAFNTVVKYPHNKQIIHLYPGGGYRNPISINTIHKDVKIVSTQNFISKYINDYNSIDVYGGPFYYKDDIITDKYRDDSILRICFTSMGDPITKGAFIYHNIASTYKEKYPADTVEFISIGNCPFNTNIIAYSAMDQLSLSSFYNSKVDIVISLDTGIACNGFPLGVEAMQEGCVVFTTDIHNQNILNGFNLDSFYIIDKNNISDIIGRIKSLVDRNILEEKSKVQKNHIFNLFNYNNTMTKIFRFITVPPLQHHACIIQEV